MLLMVLGTKKIILSTLIDGSSNFKVPSKNYQKRYNDEDIV